MNARRFAVAALASACSLAAVPATASAAADIEATWSFSGGQVVVRAVAGGFEGVIIKPTTFATCPHPTGERVWSGVTLQADGQYFGGHQWFDGGCAPIPTRGHSAFRVLMKPDGTPFLRACFAPPEQPDFQPTIAADGTPANDGRTCADSDLVPPAAAPTIADVATLPSQGKKKCLSNRSFKIRLKEPKGDALDTAKVYVTGRPVQTIKHDRITAPVNLKGLPKGRYTVRIVAKTVLGKTITGTRKYRTCAKKKQQKSTSRV